MKVGNLVRMTQENYYDLYGKVGIITKHNGFLVVVVFPCMNGEGICVRPNSFEVISESR